MEPIARPLLAWYRRHRRVLPFREEPTPYRVWVSEVMLQQTRVSAALPYYERFMAALPDIPSLAACGGDELHKLWQGLGYYNRAKNLQKAAEIVMAKYGGELPASYEALLALPGIGAYTAGAIASIAFGLAEVAVDGNVLRVFSRLLAEQADVSLPKVKQALTAEVRAQMPKDAPGDYNQALMELGALVCTPGVPGCAACPLTPFCEGRRRGIEKKLPTLPPKKAKREDAVCLLLVFDEKGRVLLHRRPAKGLLAGLYEPLLFEGKFTKGEVQKRLEGLLPGAVLEGALPGASHVFTHRVWRMYGWQGRAKRPGTLPGGYIWATAAQLEKRFPLPSAFRPYFGYLQAE